VARAAPVPKANPTPEVAPVQELKATPYAIVRATVAAFAVVDPSQSVQPTMYDPEVTTAHPVTQVIAVAIWFPVPEGETVQEAIARGFNGKAYVEALTATAIYLEAVALEHK